MNNYRACYLFKTSAAIYKISCCQEVRIKMIFLSKILCHADSHFLLCTSFSLLQRKKTIWKNVVNESKIMINNLIKFIYKQFLQAKIYEILKKWYWKCKKANSTRSSQAVSHLSTILAQCCLISVIGRELVCSTWYGRWQVMKPNIIFLSKILCHADSHFLHCTAFSLLKWKKTTWKHIVKSKKNNDQ